MVLMLDGKTDLNKISLTGMRAITLLGLLAIAPRSMKEIREAFINCNIMEQSHSNDIIRIDINTLKSFGCEISRSSAKTEFKYVLSKHPFIVPITEGDIKLLKKLFDKVKNTMDVYKLLEYEKLLKKIAENIFDNELKEKFLGISPFRHYNVALIKELLFACEQGYTVKLNYHKPYAQSDVKEIVAQRLLMKNDKLYLYGYDLDRQDSNTLLFKRIESVVSKRITDKGYKQDTVKVQFVLKDTDCSILTENEKVMNKIEDSCYVEGTYFNEFLAIQRVLSLGPKCIVKEPVEFRNKIISKLKSMRKLYEEEKSD